MAFTVKLDDSHEQALALSGSEPSGYGLGRFGWVWIKFEQDLPPTRSCTTGSRRATGLLRPSA